MASAFTHVFFRILLCFLVFNYVSIIIHFVYHYYAWRFVCPLRTALLCPTKPLHFPSIDLHRSHAFLLCAGLYAALLSFCQSICIVHTHFCFAQTLKHASQMNESKFDLTKSTGFAELAHPFCDTVAGSRRSVSAIAPVTQVAAAAVRAGPTGHSQPVVVPVYRQKSRQPLLVVARRRAPRLAVAANGGTSR
jgi:hypothetical protein